MRFLALVCVVSLTAMPVMAAELYGASDFLRVEKVDAHVHLHGPAERFMAQAVADHVRVLTINVDYPDYPPIDVQQRDAIALAARYPGRAAWAATISVATFGSPDWAAGQLRRLDEALERGAVGVKVWKNIGMGLRDADGHFVLLDDRRLAPVFDRLERDDVVLLAHQAEPLNCWLPFERMTIKSDREYFSEHPQYYMYKHHEMPTREAQLAARDRVLVAHPKLRADAVHLASLEFDVEQVALFLDRFPNAVVDVAARMNHLEYQASIDRNKVRDFMTRYQDRILYGTDTAIGPADTDESAAKDAHAAWLADWQFLTSAERQHSPDFEQAYRGLALPKSVVDKIYRENARRVFLKAWRFEP
jgi:predicted TIM-barrel fold metal-dependent hydrolase